MGSMALRLLGFLSFPRGFQLGIRNRCRNWGGNSNWNYSTKSFFSWKSTWSEEGLGDVEVITRLGGGLSPGLNHRPSFKCHYTIYWSLIWYIYNMTPPASFHFRQWSSIFTDNISLTAFSVIWCSIYQMGHVNNGVAFPASSWVIPQIEGWDGEITQ